MLALVAVGCGNAEVADRLSLSVQTVKSYLKAAMAKLDTTPGPRRSTRLRRAGLIP